MPRSFKNLLGAGLGALTARLINGVVFDGLTATGTTQAGALVLPGDVNVITSVPTGSGVVLPVVPQPGDEILVTNADPSNALLVYPAPGGSIQGGAVNAPVSVGAGQSVTFIGRIGSLSWIVLISATGSGTSFPSTVDGTILAPSLALASAQSAYPIQFSIGSLGDAQSGDTIWLERRDSSLSVIDYFFHTITDADLSAISGGVVALSFPGLSAITTGTWRWYAYRQRGSARSNGSSLVISGPNDIAPTISALTTTSITSAAVTVGFTTNWSDGTAYYVITTSATAPTAAQVIAGQNNAGTAAVKSGSLAVSAPGALAFAASTGLTASTTYYAYVVQAPAVGPNSTVLSGSFATTAAATQTLLWSATDKNAAVTLTNSNKTATVTGGPVGVRSAIVLPTTGKKYIEIAIAGSGGIGTLSVGLVNGSVSLSSYMGADTNAYAAILKFGGENFNYNNTSVQTVGAATAPFTLCLAIDATNKKISGRIDGGNWNGNSINDPATGTNVADYSALTGTLYLGFSSDRTGDNATIRSVSTDMLFSIPSGFSTID